MAGNRVDFIDFAKGIGILTVVWGHIMLVGWSHQLIYAFHMPFFFFASGLLFNREKYSSFGGFLKRRAKGMLLPYAIYSVVTWIVWALFRLLRHDEVESFIAPLLQTIWSQGSGEFMVHNSALWFIPCLFAVESMYFFVSRLGDAKALLASFCIAAVGLILAQCFGKKYLMTMPWNLDAAFYALPFYCVADVFKRKMPPVAFAKMVNDNRFGMTGLLVVLIAVLCILAFRFGECSMGSSSYNCNIGIFMTRAFVGTFALIILSVLAVRLCDNAALQWLSDCIKWCGRNSIHIMCVHIPVKGVAALVIARIIHLKGDASGACLLAIAVFCVTMAVVWTVVWTIDAARRTMRNLSTKRIPA